MPRVIGSVVEGEEEEQEIRRYAFQQYQQSYLLQHMSREKERKKERERGSQSTAKEFYRYKRVFFLSN